jgi:hypothetical protein
LFAETPAVFQANTATPATQFAFDLAGNALTNSAATSVSLFTAIPATGTSPTGVASLDWTPVAGSAIAAGGLATFTGKVATEGRHLRDGNELRRRGWRRRHEVVVGLDDVRS